MSQKVVVGSKRSNRDDSIRIIQSSQFLELEVEELESKLLIYIFR